MASRLRKWHTRHSQPGRERPNSDADDIDENTCDGSNTALWSAQAAITVSSPWLAPKAYQLATHVSAADNGCNLSLVLQPLDGQTWSNLSSILTLLVSSSSSRASLNYTTTHSVRGQQCKNQGPKTSFVGSLEPDMLDLQIFQQFF